MKVDELDELIAELGGQDITLWVESGELRFRAPRGAMTPQWRALLREHRDAVVAHLGGDNGVPGFVHDPDARYEPFPLSDLQAAYLVGRSEHYEHGGVACHAYVELAYPADLDPARVQAAWDALVARHDMLRALVHPDAYQVVLPDPPHFRIEVTDLRGCPAHEVEVVVSQVRDALSHRVARTDRWPLCVPRLTRSDARLLLHLSLDLLVIDYASVQVLLRELDLLCADPAAALPPLRATFRDYLVGRRRRTETAAYHRDREYWTARLDDFPPAPELPVASPSAAAAATARTVRFTRLEHLLPAADWSRLRDRARSHGVTASTTILTAYAEVVGRWSRSPRFTLNLPTFQRAGLPPDAGVLVGDFTAVELLEVDLTEPVDFAERAARLSAQLLDDLSHSLFTGSEVVAEIARRGDGARPLMPVVFTSTLDTADSAGSTGTPLGDVVFAISQTPQVWIDCQAMERGDRLALTWDVRQGVFPDGLAEAAFAAFVSTVERLVGDGRSWSLPAPVELPTDQRDRRRAVNDTAGELPGELLHAAVFAQADITPDAVAVQAGDRVLSYRELAGRARAVAAVLGGTGLRPAEPVVVAMEKGWEQVVAVLGVLLAQGAYLPVDTSQPAARRNTIIADAGARTVLTQSWLLTTGDWPADVVLVDVDALVPVEPAALDDVPPPVGPDDLAYVIYTSGSTGTPKGVMISHRAAGNTVVDVNRRFGITASDTVLGLASLGFDLSVYDVFGPLSVGARLVLPEESRRGDPSHWAELVREHGVTVWNSVPGQMRMLADFLQSTPGCQLRTLRLAMLSGDWIPVPLPDEIRRLVPGLQVVSLGGATEGAIWSIFHPVGEVDPTRPSIPYGTPLTNQTFAVLDDAMHDRPDWVPGELYIGGAGVATGYLGDEQRTAERFVVHPVSGDRLYRTGDLGRYLPDGTVEFLGREDSQVKIRGYRIELAEVETAVLTHPAVAAGAVVVDEAHALGRRLAAFVEPARLADDETRATIFDPAAGARVVEAAAAAVSAAAADVDPDALRRFSTATDEVALGVMARTLADAGLFDGASHDADEICAMLRATPTTQHVVRRWLRALAAVGRLTAEDGPTGPRYRRLNAPSKADLKDTWRRLGDTEREVPHSADLVDLLRTCVDHLPALVNGEQDVRALLFPGAETDALDTVYRDNLAVRHLNRGVVAGLRRLAEQHGGDGGLRMLEIGGGVAGTTTELVPALAELGVDYLFTDPSRFFLSSAEELFGDYPCVRFARFDLADELRPQGFAPNTFDVVLCPNVLHATTDVTQALRRVTELLVPGGWLVAMENVRDDHYPLLVSLEFLEASSGPRTDLRAEHGQSFVTEDQWLELLAAAGADVVGCLPEPGDVLHAAGQRILFARAKTDRRPVTEQSLARHVGDRLPEYMAPAYWQVVDALPRTANGKLDRTTLQGWLPSGSPERNPGRSVEPVDVLERQLAALWADLLGVAQVGRHDDFFALGGDSLLVARLVGQVREQVPDVVALEWEVVLRHMLRRPTVAALATYLRAATGPSSGPEAADQKASPLVRLHGTGLDAADPGAPVTVLVHAGTGTLMPYRALITEVRRRSAGTAALVGLEIPRLQDYLDADPTGQVERLAAGYVQALLHLGPRELHVVGYCLGGLIALEVARGLAEAGGDVATLTAISSHSPRFRLDDELLAEYSFSVMMGIDPTALGFPGDEHKVAAASAAVLAESPGVLLDGGLAGLDGEFADVAACFRKLAQVPRPTRVARMCETVPASAGMYELDHMTRLLRTFRQSVFSISRYRPEPYAGDVTFLRHSGTYPFPGSKEAVTEQWDEVCLGDLRIVDVPGDHFSCMSVGHAPGVLRLLREITQGAVTQ